MGWLGNALYPVAMPLDHAGLEVLDTEQCLALLARIELGRVAVCTAGFPAIFPVNFRLLDGSVVFRTGEGTKLNSAIWNAGIAFEADAVNSIFEIGWSVMIVGRAAEVVDPTKIAETMHMGLRPWAPGSRSHVIRIMADSISGRRIVGKGETHTG